MTMQPCGGESESGVVDSAAASTAPAVSAVDFHASDLLMVLCTLIVEGRVPTVNEKGRREGPHVAQLLKIAIAGGPAAREKGWKSRNLQEQLRVLLGEAGAAHSDHNCNPQNVLCKRRGDLHHQVARFSEKGIPICVEVLLAPKCQHGARKADLLENTGPTEERDTLLLEKWDIAVSPKRHNENVSSGRMLIQAFRSYLHFSQLSSWYNMTKGKLHMNTVYRIFAPGDDASSWFTENPETHAFPLGLVSKSLVVRAKVMTLPRRPTPGPVLRLICTEKACQERVLPPQKRLSEAPVVSPAQEKATDSCSPVGSPFASGRLKSRQSTPEPLGVGATGGVSSTPPKLVELLPSPELTNKTYAGDLTVARAESSSDPAVRPRRPSGGDAGFGGIDMVRKERKIRKSSLKRSRESKTGMKAFVEAFDSDLLPKCYSAISPSPSPREQPVISRSIGFETSSSSLNFGPSGFGRSTPNSSHSSDGEFSQTPPSSSSLSAYEKELRKTKEVLRRRKIGVSVPSPSPPRTICAGGLQPRLDPLPLPSVLAADDTSPPLTPRGPSAGEEPITSPISGTVGACGLSLPLPPSPPITPKTSRGEFKVAGPKVTLSTKETSSALRYPISPPMTSPKVLFSESMYKEFGLFHPLELEQRKLKKKKCKENALPCKTLFADLENSSGSAGDCWRTSDCSSALLDSFVSPHPPSKTLTDLVSNDLIISARCHQDESLPWLPRVEDVLDKSEGLKMQQPQPDIMALDPEGRHCTVWEWNKEVEAPQSTSEDPSAVGDLPPSTFQSARLYSAKKTTVIMRSDRAPSLDGRSISGTTATALSQASGSDAVDEPNRKSRSVEKKSGVAEHPPKNLEESHLVKISMSHGNKVGDRDDTTSSSSSSTASSPPTYSAPIGKKHSRRKISPYYSSLIASSSHRGIGDEVAFDPLVKNVNNNNNTVSNYNVNNNNNNDFTGDCRAESSDCKCSRSSFHPPTSSHEETHVDTEIESPIEGLDEGKQRWNLSRQGVVSSAVRNLTAVLERLTTDLSDTNGSAPTFVDDAAPPLAVAPKQHVRSPTDGVTLGPRWTAPPTQAPLSPLVSHQSGPEGIVPSREDRLNFRSSLHSSASMLFHKRSGLPLNSSPAPMRRTPGSSCFDYDSSLTNPKEIHKVISYSRLTPSSRGRRALIESSEASPSNDSDSVIVAKEKPNLLSRSAPVSTNCLLGNFEESVLNGRLDPVGVVEGFSAEIGASGTFCPKHVTLPVTAYYFQVSDDNAPSPYLGHINLEPLSSSKGYKIPRKGTIQVTLFNPNKTVVKMFVVMYDLTDMPPNSQTFLRQRTVYMPTGKNVRGERVTKEHLETFLRYLIHLRIQSSKSGHVYLHTDIRMIFARNKFDIDSSIATYELRSFTEGPTKPKFSPKR